MKKLRVKLRKNGLIRYISHLDLMRLFQRAFRRAKIPVEYSQGYNPQPKFSFATALALGTTSDGEYMDVELKEKIDPEDFVNQMNEVLPEGVEIVKAIYTEDKKSLMAIVKWSSYVIELKILEDISQEDISIFFGDYLKKDEIFITKEKKKRGRFTSKEVNIRDRIDSIDILVEEENRLILKALLKTGSDGNLKAEDLIKSIKKEGLNIDDEEYRIHRLELFTGKNGELIIP